MLTLFANVLTFRATCLQSSDRSHISCEGVSSGRNAGVAQVGAEIRGSFRVQPPVQKSPDFRRVCIEPFGQSLGRVADARELRVELVEPGRQSILGDFPRDLLGSEMERVGERPVQVLGELKRCGQALDQKVLGLRCDDAVRIDAVLR